MFFTYACKLQWIDGGAQKAKLEISAERNAGILLLIKSPITDGIETPV